MNLDEAREILRTRAGTIKGWALREETFIGIARELGIDAGYYAEPVALFLAPVVFVGLDQPEGVIT